MNENNSATDAVSGKQLPGDFSAAAVGTKKANGVSKNSTPGNGSVRVILRYLYGCDSEGENPMGRQLVALMLGGAFAAASGAALAHHSFAMFDTDHPMELQGTVTEFKFTSPHTFILLEVKGSDGSATTWNLEGASPSALVREGWASKTLKAGDQLKMTIDPLRSGAPGGAWSEKKTNFSSGQPIVTH